MTLTVVDKVMYAMGVVYCVVCAVIGIAGAGLLNSPHAGHKLTGVCVIAAMTINGGYVGLRMWLLWRTQRELAPPPAASDGVG